MSRRLLALAAVALLAIGAAACTDKDDDATPGGIDAIAVTSSDDGCEVNVTEAPAGTVTFDVKNEGGEATEVYLLEADGEKIVDEVEDVGPGLTRTLEADVDEGDYLVRCKPGMAGDGIDVPFTVTAA